MGLPQHTGLLHHRQSAHKIRAEKDVTGTYALASGTAFSRYTGLV